MASAIDLSADLGEGFGAYRMGDDEALLDLVSSANIACGFHAGDPRVMARTVSLCAERGVAIGAHPGFPDLLGFGRRRVELTPFEIRSDVLYQVGALSAFAAAEGVRLSHVSPHGSLGNLVATERAYAEPVLDAVASFDPTLTIVTHEGLLAELAREQDVPVAIMGLADRAYGDDGQPVSRSQPGAVIADEEAVAQRVMRLVREGVLSSSTSGRDVALRCDTILLHGDTPGAVSLARRLRRELDAAGVAIRPLSTRPAASADGDGSR